MKTERQATGSETEILKHALSLTEAKFERELKTFKFFLNTILIAILIGALIGFFACVKGASSGLPPPALFFGGFGISAFVLICLRFIEYNEQIKLQRETLARFSRDFSEKTLEVYAGKIVYIKQLSVVE